jgi:hypothetical protein
MIELTRESLRAVFPRAPEAVIEAFVTKQEVLTKVGVNATRTRLAYFSGQHRARMCAASR